jgi:hypothetical protein
MLDRVYIGMCQQMFNSIVLILESPTPYRPSISLVKTFDSKRSKKSKQIWSGGILQSMTKNKYKNKRKNNKRRTMYQH